MKGILAVNHFLNTHKYNELHSHLISHALKENIELTIKTNLELATEHPVCDFVLFWDKDINLARRLENEGLYLTVLLLLKNAMTRQEHTPSFRELFRSPKRLLHRKHTSKQIFRNLLKKQLLF